MRRHRRVLVIGTSGCGKTTFARQLANRLDCPHVELDALYWGPEWVARSEAEFRSRIEAALAGEGWVVDGNYGSVRDLIWPRATAIVWLNYAFPVVMSRCLLRVVRYIARDESVYSGNRETFRRAFLSTDSILLWVLRTYRRQRRTYRALKEQATFPRLEWFELRHSRDAAAFLESLGTSASIVPEPLRSPPPSRTGSSRE